MTRRIALYNPPDLFNIFLDFENIELYDHDYAYTNHDLVLCPIFWGLSSIDQVRLQDYESALENTDQQGYRNPLLSDDIRSILKKYNAKVLLYNDWEARDLDFVKNHLIVFTTSYMKVRVSQVIYSTTNYAGHMRCLNANVLSYDWVYIREKQKFLDTNIVENRENKKHHILSLNYRGNLERYAYCYYLYQKYRDKSLFSFLDEPPELTSNFKQLLGQTYSEKNTIQFNRVLPVKIDGSQPEQHQTRTLHSFFLESYIHVMFETNWLDPKGLAQQISEKTYMSIRIGKPFLIFTSQGGILPHLRSLGFKTFSPLINEEYDNKDLSYETRFELLLRETDRICELSSEEIKSLDQKLKPLVDFNTSHLKNDRDVPNFFEMIDKMKYKMIWVSIVVFLAKIKITLKPYYRMIVKP